MDGNKKSIIVEYSIFRIILTILVLLGHSSYLCIHSQYGNFDIIDISKLDLGMGQNFLYLITFIIYSFHMPAFFFLSGAVYAVNADKYNNIGKFLCKKVMRLIIPFLIVTSLYVVPVKYYVGYWNSTSDLLKDIIVGQYLLQGNNSLWFLPALFLLFCVFCLFKHCYNKSIIITIAALFICSSLHWLFPIKILSILTEYSFFFLLGIFFERNNRLSKFYEKRSFFMFMSLIYVLLLGIKFLIRNSSFTCLFAIITTLTAIPAILILWGGVQLYCKISRGSTITRLSQFSMGIYLYSDTLNYVILYFIAKNGFSLYLNNSFFCITLYLFRFVVTFLVSMVITKLFKYFNLKWLY